MSRFLKKKKNVNPTLVEFRNSNILHSAIQEGQLQSVGRKIFFLHDPDCK
jgi:hypothetical protein